MRFLAPLALVALLSLAPGAAPAAPGEPPAPKKEKEFHDPIRDLIKRTDKFLHHAETDGVTRDPRDLRDPPEEIRLSVVPQLLAYCELYRCFPKKDHYQDVVDRADFLFENLKLAVSGGPTDGMLAFAMLRAYAITGDFRYWQAAAPIVKRCLTLQGFDARLNWGLMGAMGLAEYYRQTGDPDALQKVRDLVAGVSREQHLDGSLPHLCAGTRDVHYTDWIAMELILIGERIEDATLQRVLDSAYGFMCSRVDLEGMTHYEEMPIPGRLTYFYSIATGCWQDYDTRGWNNELGYSALLFDRYGDSRYQGVTRRLDELDDHGAYADKWDFMPAPDDPIFPWADEKHSVIRTSVIFWSLTSLYADRVVRQPGKRLTDPTEDPVALTTPVAATMDFSGTGAQEAEVAPAGAAGLDFGPVTPNPARGDCAVALRLPEATEVSLDVFDASGRRVRTLPQGVVAAGQRQVRWDGRDAVGAPVPAGLYLMRLRAGDRLMVARLAIVR